MPVLCIFQTVLIIAFKWAQLWLVLYQIAWFRKDFMNIDDFWKIFKKPKNFPFLLGSHVKKGQITLDECLVHPIHYFIPGANTEILNLDFFVRKYGIFSLMKWPYHKIEVSVKKILPLKKKSKRGSKFEKWKNEKCQSDINWILNNLTFFIFWLFQILPPLWFFFQRPVM